MPGYLGPIIYSGKPWDWRLKKRGLSVFVKWTVTREENEASVMIQDWIGDLSAGSQWVRLKKISGRWVVTKRECGPCS